MNLLQASDGPYAPGELLHELRALRSFAAHGKQQLVMLEFWPRGQENAAALSVLVGHFEAENTRVEIAHAAEVVDMQAYVAEFDNVVHGKIGRSQLWLFIWITGRFGFASLARPGVT